nr:MAG TPA: hypothetical protein [Caudoviricetes sp.]
MFKTSDCLSTVATTLANDSAIELTLAVNSSTLVLTSHLNFSNATC